MASKKKIHVVDSLLSNLTTKQFYQPMPQSVDKTQTNTKNNNQNTKASSPCIHVQTITKDNIVIKLTLTVTESHKVRYYIYQCGRENDDDLGTIEVKKNRISGTATIDLEDINDKLFQIALYENQNRTTPISNRLSFCSDSRGNVLQLNDEFSKECTVSSMAIPKDNCSDSDEYTGMYSQDNYTQQQDEKSELLALEVYGIKCDEISCGNTFHPREVFICIHPDCTGDINIYCYDCGTYKHRNKKHDFNPYNRYIKCMEDFCEPNQKEFSNAKEMAKILVNVSAVEKFLWHHRWSLGIISKTLASGGVTGLSVAVNGHATIAAACGTGHSLIVHGLIAGALGCVAGPAIGTILESIFIWKQWQLERISTEEAFELVGVSLFSNAAAATGYFGVMAIGAAVGAPGGPIGMAVGFVSGAIAAAILLGFGSRWFLNKRLKKKFKNRHEVEIKLQKDALIFFFNDEKYPIDDETKFNEKILRKEYHRLCVIYHPDKNGGKYDEWLKLSSYYGVLIGIWEKKHEREVNVNDMSEEQRSMVFNSALKYHATADM